jgi:hypothetical protein
MRAGFPAASIFTLRGACEKNFLALSANRILLYFGPFLKPKNVVKSPKNQGLTGKRNGPSRQLIGGELK